MGLGAYSPFKADRLMNAQQNAVEAGTAGMSEAEKNQRKAKATEMAGQQVGAMQQDLSQQALASGGMQQGANTKAMLQLGGAAAEAGANASEQIEAQSAEIAEQKRQEAMAHYQQSKANKMALLDSAVGKLVSPSLTQAGKTLAVDNVGETSDDPGDWRSQLTTLGLGLLPLAFCWVAREVVPSEWREARTGVLFTAPRWFRRFYLQHGEKAASWLRTHSWAKPLVRPLFRYFAKRGRAFEKANIEQVATINAFLL